MTQTLDTAPTHWPDPNLDGIHTLTSSNNDYLRRIHWWVRLFGIIWIVVPVVFGLAAGAFLLGVGFFHGTSEVEAPSSYSKCVAERDYSASTCARMYPR